MHLMQIDLMALCLVIAAFALTYIFRRFFFALSRNTYLSYPSLAPLEKRTPTVLEKFRFLPKMLAVGSLIAFSFAFIDPHYFEEGMSSDSPPEEGLAIYLVLDHSGSMQAAVPQGTRLDVLKNASLQLIRKFPKDLIGAIAFARAADVISPLTLHHKLLEKRLLDLKVVKDQEQDGTSIGYAIYKTAHLIAAMKTEQLSDETTPYKIQKAIMIVLTDGFQDPSYLDKGNRLRAMELDEATNFAKEQEIKVFIINIDPSIQQEKFLPNLRELQRASEITGGKGIVVGDLSQLVSILNEIPQEEKSKIYGRSQEALQKRVSFYPYLIAIGLLLLGICVFFEEVIWRKIV